ncbi:hypothetical protein K439DRAFT_1632225 [Ramaria rubella]|nr:hypothetical protein K439DRAFT_1632225 [Ramaria rubella]
MSVTFVYAALDWMAYLRHPPPSSWVVRVAASFRILAFVLIVPWVFLTALDVASYMIVRTLGADTTYRLDKPKAVPYQPSESPPSPHPTLRHDSHKSPDVMVSSESEPDEPAGDIQSETCFSTSSDANFALAGEGIFSPPASRSASPPIIRYPRIASLCNVEGEDTSIIRKRG